MKLVVSSIAWTNEEDEAVANTLQSLGVRYLELAPTKRWVNPTITTIEEVAAHKAFWESYGIEVVAFQSMLFNRPDLKIFESNQNRREAVDYLKDFTRLAHDFGARIMVYGSPKNRQRGKLDMETATELATKFFKEIGDNAQSQGVTFCIEPNPTVYACDFISNTSEGIKFVKQVNSPGFGLHLDIAGMTLAGDDVAASIRSAGSQIVHFHISSPYLEAVEDREDVAHREAAAALQEIGYDGFVSIEMRPGEAGENTERVAAAVRFAQSVYGD